METSEVDGHCGVAASASEPLAERIRRTLDPIDTAGVSEPLHCPERTSFGEDVGGLLSFIATAHAGAIVKIAKLGASIIAMRVLRL